MARICPVCGKAGVSLYWGKRSQSGGRICACCGSSVRLNLSPQRWAAVVFLSGLGGAVPLIIAKTSYAGYWLIVLFAMGISANALACTGPLAAEGSIAGQRKVVWGMLLGFMGVALSIGLARIWMSGR